MKRLSIAVLLASILTIINVNPTWSPFYVEPWEQKPQVGALSCDSKNEGLLDQNNLDELNKKANKNYSLKIGERWAIIDGDGLWRLTLYCNPDKTVWKAALWIKRIPGTLNPDHRAIIVMLSTMEANIGGGIVEMPQHGNIVRTPRGKMYGAIHKSEGYNIVIITTADIPLKENLELEAPKSRKGGKYS